MLTLIWCSICLDILKKNTLVFNVTKDMTYHTQGFKGAVMAVIVW